MTRSQRLIRDAAIVALVFQVVHFVEHMAQLSYWFANPTQAPWLTPWAVVGRDVLAIDGTAGGGNEILHLFGNVVFFGGLVALVVIAVNTGWKAGHVPYLGGALILQGFHVGEHLLLTLSYLGWGSAIGFTTLFGTATGVFGSSLRVWAHFLLNLGATYYAVRAVWEMYRMGLLIDRPPVREAELAS